MQGLINDRAPATSARIMVALGFNPNSQRLLDAAKRLAQGLNGALFAVHIQQPSNHARVYQANLDWHIQHAKDIGAQVDVIEAGVRRP